MCVLQIKEESHHLNEKLHSHLKVRKKSSAPAQKNFYIYNIIYSLTFSIIAIPATILHPFKKDMTAAMAALVRKTQRGNHLAYFYSTRALSLRSHLWNYHLC